MIGDGQFHAREQACSMMGWGGVIDSSVRHVNTLWCLSSSKCYHLQSSKDKTSPGSWIRTTAFTVDVVLHEDLYHRRHYSYGDTINGEDCM